MTEYINKDFYKAIPPQERHYINLNGNSIRAVMDKLNSEGIVYSATISDYKNVVTVHIADRERASAIAAEFTAAKSADVKIIGNTEYKYISDKRYINMDRETALKVAAVLSGDNRSHFSGRIVGDKATITVSGDKNAVAVRRIAENIKNMDLLTELEAAGFERLNTDKGFDGFVHFRNKRTGAEEGFDGLDMVRDMFYDTEVEFFHPTAYKIDLTSDAHSDVYYISRYDLTTENEKEPYTDKNGDLVTFDTVEDAVNFGYKNDIPFTNPPAEIAEWKIADDNRESKSISAENIKRIEAFPMQNYIYPDHIRFNEKDNSFYWVYFNPDADNGDGAFVEKYISEEDIYAAYKAREEAESEADGRNAFISYIFENCRENNIDTSTAYFEDYAVEYINRPENTVEFYGIGAESIYVEEVTAFITLLEEKCPSVVKDKQAEKPKDVLDLDSDNIEIEGYTGTWYVIEAEHIKGKDLFLLESEYYGDEAACLIVDGERNLVMDDVHNRFADYLERIAVPENQMIIPDEDAQEMWTYGFDVYMNGEKLPPFIEGEDERNRQIYASMEIKENYVSAVKEDVSTYHNADSIATTVFEISESYNGTPVAGEPYYLYLDKNYEDYEWQNWKREYNSYQNTMYSLTHGLAQNVEDYLLNVMSDTLVVAQRERALANVKLVSLFKTEEQKKIAEETPAVEELSYSEQLYEKVNGEYNAFISDIKKESPDVLIQSAAEIVDKDRIRLYLEEYVPELTDEQYKALLSRENPLDEIYEQWTENSELHGLEDVGIALEETADRILVSLEREQPAPVIEEIPVNNAEYSYINWNGFDKQKYDELVSNVKNHISGSDYAFLFVDKKYNNYQLELNIRELGNEWALDYDIYDNDTEEYIHCGGYYGNAEFPSFDMFISQVEDEVKSMLEEKQRLVFMVEQNGETAFFRNDEMTVERLKRECVFSDKPFLYAMNNGSRISGITFAEISQTENGLAVEINVDNKTVRIYNNDYADEKSFDEIRDEITAADISEALDLENNNLTFSVVSIDGDEDFVVGGFADNDRVMETDEYINFIDSHDVDNVTVRVDFFSVGNNQLESEDMSEEQVKYVRDHLDDVIKIASVLDVRSYDIEPEIDDDYEIAEETPSKLQRAINYINDYISKKFNIEASVVSDENLEYVSLGYTELGDNAEYPFQVEADLKNFAINYYINRNLMRTDKYDSIDELTKKELENLNFEYFVVEGNSLLEEMLEKEAEKSAIEQAKEYIREYVGDNYGENEYFTNMKNISLDHCTVGRVNEYIFNMVANLENFSIRYMIDGNTVQTEQYSSIEEMNNKALSQLDYTANMALANRLYEEYERKQYEEQSKRVEAAVKAAIKPDTFIEPEKMPLYTKSISEAKELDERDKYFADRKESEKCASAIDRAISANYNNNRLDTDSVLADVLKDYTFERIAFVVASRVAMLDYDGRIDKANIEWAKAVVAQQPDKESYHLNSHPGLINLFADTVRKEIDRVREQEQNAPESTVTAEAETVEVPVRKGFTSNIAPTTNMIDNILRCGSNEPYSLERIVRQFQKNKSVEKNAEFLKKEFGEDGRGYIINEYSEFNVSAWFNENGITVAVGETAFPSGSKAHISWEEAAERIKAMLEKGNYCSQEIIDSARNKDIKDIADNLWYLHQDSNIKPFFIPDYFFDGGFDNSTDRIAEALHGITPINEIAEGLSSFIDMYEKNPEVMRFHFHKPAELLERIKDLRAEYNQGKVKFEYPEFKTNADFSFEPKHFITEDEKDWLLLNGSGVSGGKFRIQEFFKQEHNAKEKADFLKNEYGTGGVGRSGYSSNHDSKGIDLSKGREENKCKADMKWGEVVKRIDRLVEADVYISPKDIENRIRNAKRDIARGDYADSYDKHVMDNAMKILDEYGIEYEMPQAVIEAKKNTYEIYQIPRGEQYHDLRFLRYEQLEKTGQQLDPKNYEKVYSGSLDDIPYANKLEGIFTVFNIEHPKDFEGHSLSVSDVVVIDDENGKHAYYCDSVGYKDITDMFLNRSAQTIEQPAEEETEKVNAEPAVTIGVIEKYGLEIDFNSIVGVDIESEELAYIGGIDSDGHERKDNYGVNYVTTSFEYTDDLTKSIYIDRELTSFSEVTLSDVLADIEKALDERNKVYINHKDGTRELIDAKKLLDEKEKSEQKQQNETAPQRKSGDEVEVGDKFLYKDREYTVTSMLGVYPNDVGVSYFEQSSLRTYQVTSNIDRYELANNGVYLGNPMREKEQEIRASEQTDVYKPSVYDVVEYDNQLYSVADISDGKVTLVEMDSLFGNHIVVPEIDLVTSDSLYVVESQQKLIDSYRKPKGTNFVITDDNFGVPGGAKARYADNVVAIKTLKQIEAENRTATPEEQQILSKYTGWGAIPQAFDMSNEKWKEEYAELKELLSPEEYSAARHSTMNAHFTSPVIISAIYEGLKNLGFESGKILEPAMGIGNFFGTLPEEMRNSKLYGVELDSITGRIAQQLYQTADIQIKGFEQTTFADNSFDVAVGNVPFGDYKVNDRKYNDMHLLIHDYFAVKMLDKVRPGGVVAFVTSKGTLDKENPEIRKYLAQRAELLGAIRLPNNAFKSNAGTEVTSDIIFLQKRDRPIEINPDEVEWLHKSETADGFSVNNYFVQHPEMVLGKIAEAKHIYGPTENTQVLPVEGADLKQQLAEAVKNIKGEYVVGEIEENKDIDEIPAPANSRKYSFYAVDGNLYYREAEDTMRKVEVPKDTLNRAVGLIELRDNVRELLDLQLENSDGSLDNDIVESRKNLNERYDFFVAQYGEVSDRKNAKAMQGDDGYNIVSALENKDEKGQVTGKSDIFFHNTVKPKVLATHVETAQEALILSVAEKAKVDFEYMTQLCGMEKDKLISELEGQIFRLPQEEEKYVTADEYLTGNIRKKIAELENAPEDMDVTNNRTALENAMPPRVEAKDISVKLGAHWVDPKYIADFIIEKFRPDYDTKMGMDVQYSAVAGTWKIENVKGTAKNNYYATKTYGTNRKNAYEIIEGILNNSDLQVKDRVKDEYGNDVRDSNGKYVLVVNDEETKAVRRCANIIKSEFQDWIFQDHERREALVQKYNETYNSIRHREYDGSHLNFSGMNSEITLKEHQKNAVARGLYGGNCLLAHAVGAGKTYEMIAIAMEGKRLGLHNKCLFAVPNSLTEQMGNDFRKLYPNANILVATQKDFEKSNRLKLFGKIAANDWDAVIIGHSQFDRMGLSPEREKSYLMAEVEKLRFELEMAAAENDGKKSFTVKQIEKSIANYEDKLEKLNDAQVKDGFIDFEQLGFDKVFVDESHMYKNLATATKMHNVSGLGTQGSARAFNLLMKSKYLDEFTGGRGLTFASGTPVSNSMTELYTLMRYLQAGMLKDLGINHFDEWAADFGEVKTDYELKPESDGKYQLKTRFAKFTNLPELMGIFKEAADIRTADTLDLDKPDAVVTEVVAKPSKIQRRAIKSLGKRAAEIRTGTVDPREDNMLKITSDGRKIGLDQRLLNPALPDDPNSKVNLCVKNVFDIYTQTTDTRSTQCIFCDLSTPKAESRQDKFVIFRPDSRKPLGYDVIRKKTGIKKDMDFDKIRKHVDSKAAEEDDKLKIGDIAVIRRPSEDMTKIISEAGIYENGKFITDESEKLLEQLGMSPIEDMPPKEFNVYDDIKKKLMVMGVPEDEIAFIHDYDTPEQKQALFNQMNAGEVRVLLGSTAKCGAGMNAQQKMIALHHLDAPMRPSDMEQRNGRIERQGNENPEVQIYRYVTDKTFDAYLYQMLENKQRFISQVMTSKTPERTCSDIDEVALDYAEVKALCAGNPLIKEEMQLQTQIKELKSEKSRYSEKIYELQDNIRINVPAKIKATELHIKHNQIDLDTANAQPKVVNDEGKEMYPIKIGDKVYTDRAEAGEAIKDVLLKNFGKLAEGSTVHIGEYRGMKLSFLHDLRFKTTKACLEGEKNHYCDLNIETTTGNLIRLDNCINNIAKDIKESQEKVDTMKAELEQMKIDVEAPFPKADELFKAETRLEEVHEALTKFELSDDTMHRDIYERFADNFSNVLFGRVGAMKYEAGEGWDTLSVELNDNVFSIAHTYVQNGDLMYDPMISFIVDYENEKVIPISYENSGLGIYESYDPNAEPTPQSVQNINGVLEFMDTWLDNIEQQGYEPAVPDEDRSRKTENISL